MYVVHAAFAALARNEAPSKTTLGDREHGRRSTDIWSLVAVPTGFPLGPVHRSRRRFPVRRLSRVDRCERRTVPAATRTTRPRGSCAGRRRRSSREG
jgi:hypothetical protein